ncbi:MAG: ATP-dependent Clp protease adapter ClpS [Bdellovibrionales bacterium]|nr:ATP-dependent Clp protease adapter ClpS [Bdellovibrionales bacterium]
MSGQIWSNVSEQDKTNVATVVGALPPVKSNSGPPALPPDDGDANSSTGTLTKTRPQVKEPSMFKVILLNDDFTPMDFVVHVLRKFFHKVDPEATAIMLQVHHQGAGVAGVFSHEIAETKVYLVNEYSKQNQHPLKCIMEKDQ